MSNIPNPKIIAPPSASPSWNYVFLDFILIYQDFLSIIYSLPNKKNTRLDDELKKVCTFYLLCKTDKNKIVCKGLTLKTFLFIFQADHIFMISSPQRKSHKKNFDLLIKNNTISSFFISSGFFLVILNTSDVY